MSGYSELHAKLKDIYDPTKEYIEVNEKIGIYNFPFTSESCFILPGENNYFCRDHNVKFTEELGSKNELFDSYPEHLHQSDIDFKENREFNYVFFKNRKQDRAEKVILLFHGLNEKHWEKYLPWAYKLVELTGYSVLLFPIAFHMNRSPAAWSDPRSMSFVSGLRKKYSRSITNSTFANAAISARIQTIPQRFFWSGLQTYYDVVKLIKEIRAGKNHHISPDMKLDLFSYSIGAFLSQILIMANPEKLFDGSRLAMFCGGPCLDRMSPNSRFILDSDATIAIYSFYTERLESELLLDKRLAHYFNGSHISGSYFKSMLSYRKDKEFREKRFRELSSNIYAIALKKDYVIPANEVLNTLQGDFRDIPVKVEVDDFNFPYSHITPFPLEEEYDNEVTLKFNEVFQKAANFYLG